MRKLSESNNATLRVSSGHICWRQGECADRVREGPGSAVLKIEFMGLLTAQEVWVPNVAKVEGVTVVARDQISR